MKKISHATAIACADHWLKDPVKKWVKQFFGVERVDFVTEHQPETFLTIEKKEKIVDIQQKLTELSKDQDGELVIIVAHDGCDYGVVPVNERQAILAEAAQKAQRWGHGQRIIGLWLDEDNEPEMVYDSYSAQSDVWKRAA